MILELDLLLFIYYEHGIGILKQEEIDQDTAFPFWTPLRTDWAVTPLSSSPGKIDRGCLRLPGHKTGEMEIALMGLPEL